MLAITLENVIENEFPQELGFFTTAEVNRFDFAADVALLVGEEKVIVATAADERFFFDTLKALLDFSSQSQTVGVDLINAKRNEVINVALDFLDVADKEQHLEQLDV